MSTASARLKFFRLESSYMPPRQALACASYEDSDFSMHIHVNVMSAVHVGQVNKAPSHVVGAADNNPLGGGGARIFLATGVVVRGTHFIGWNLRTPSFFRHFYLSLGKRSNHGSSTAVSLPSSNFSMRCRNSLGGSTLTSLILEQVQCTRRSNLRACSTPTSSLFIRLSQDFEIAEVCEFERFFVWIM